MKKYSDLALDDFIFEVNFNLDRDNQVVISEAKVDNFLKYGVRAYKRNHSTYIIKPSNFNPSKGDFVISDNIRYFFCTLEGAKEFATFIQKEILVFLKEKFEHFKKFFNLKDLPLDKQLEFFNSSSKELISSIESVREGIQVMEIPYEAYLTLFFEENLESPNLYFDFKSVEELHEREDLDFGKRYGEQTTCMAINLDPLPFLFDSDDFAANVLVTKLSTGEYLHSTANIGLDTYHKGMFYPLSKISNEQELTVAFGLFLTMLEPLMTAKAIVKKRTLDMLELYAANSIFEYSFLAEQDIIDYNTHNLQDLPF